MSIVWATTHTRPSVVGIVIAAKAIGTTIPPSVPNMTTITRIAIGMPIDSARRRASLKIFWVSRLIAGKPERYVVTPAGWPIAARSRGVAVDASWFSSGVAIWA